MTQCQLSVVQCEFGEHPAYPPPDRKKKPAAFGCLVTDAGEALISPKGVVDLQPWQLGDY